MRANQASHGQTVAELSRSRNEFLFSTRQSFTPLRHGWAVACVRIKQATVKPWLNYRARATISFSAPGKAS